MDGTMGTGGFKNDHKDGRSAEGRILRRNEDKEFGNTECTHRSCTNHSRSPYIWRQWGRISANNNCEVDDVEEKTKKERAQLTHRNKPVNPKRTIVANRPSTEASKPWPRHTVFPARDSRPLAGIGEEVEERWVGEEDDEESRGVFVTEFVDESREKDDEEKEGEVERDDVGVVYGGYVEDIPEEGDDEMSHEHESEGAERDVVPEAHR